jgi:hypothetical protein
MRKQRNKRCDVEEGRVEKKKKTKKKKKKKESASTISQIRPETIKSEFRFWE